LVCGDFCAACASDTDLLDAEYVSLKANKGRFVRYIFHGGGNNANQKKFPQKPSRAGVMRGKGAVFAWRNRQESILTGVGLR
jgi:hypothetical protein